MFQLETLGNHALDVVVLLGVGIKAFSVALEIFEITSKFREFMSPALIV